ncbi:MAG: VWA domain-containing protein, partial [Verrucomicrobia bacterium]|nr:VWA domain-containing protein [Verrucomicrobiota bacterium]
MLLRIFHALFPTPRRAVRGREGWPLGIFLLLFLGGALLAHARGWLRFSNPAAFWLTLTLPWFWWQHVASAGGGLRGARATVALLTRFTLAAALILLLAQPRAVRTSRDLSLIYALDLSDSMGSRVSDNALNFVLTTARDKPPRDEAGLVVFARDAAVELPPRRNLPFEAINSRVSRDATDLNAALALSAAVLPETNTGRIVLISDGNATDGNLRLAATLDELKARGVAVDVLPVSYDLKNEVWLERLDLPRFVKAGETYEAAVILSSLQRGSGKLTLRENGKVIVEENVTFDAGKNRFALPLYLRGPGYYEYTATIDPAPGADTWRENNVALGELFLPGAGRVLCVTDPQGDGREIEPLLQALRGGSNGRAVETQSAYDFPRDALALLPYDAIIFADAPADAFDPAQLQALHDAVFNQGSGFLMVGGKNGFGPGGWHRTAVEETLPVEMDIQQKKVLPKGALVIVLHTCEFAEGNTYGKRIAKEAIRVLGAQDEAGLLAYDSGGERWIFPLTPAGEYQRLATLINQCEPGDMPSFAPIMQMGFDALKASDAAAKHMIVISDGDPSPPAPALVQAFVDNKISVSMVAINPHGGIDISIMQSVAATTGGRYYFPQDPNQLPAIFIKEAKTLKRSMIQNKTFVPSVTFPSPILKGIDGPLPELRGYTLTTPKARALTILKGPETEDTDPILAQWRFGLGTTAAWTSDLSRNWAAAWVDWEKYAAFVKGLLTEFSRVETRNDLRLRATAEGDTGVIVAEDFAPGEETFLELLARVTGPGGRTENVPLRQTGPRRYEGRFPLWGRGRYGVVAAGVGGGGRQEHAVAGFAQAYSAEYLRFRS